jgi:hypothetical protein
MAGPIALYTRKKYMYFAAKYNFYRSILYFTHSAALATSVLFGSNVKPFKLNARPIYYIGFWSMLRASPPVLTQTPNTKFFGYANPIWSLVYPDLVFIVSTRDANNKYLV